MDNVATTSILTQILTLITVGGIVGAVSAFVTVKVSTRIKLKDLCRRLGKIEDKVPQALYNQDGSLIYARAIDFKEQRIKCEGQMREILEKVEEAIRKINNSNLDTISKDLTEIVRELKKDTSGKNDSPFPS